MRLFTLDNRLSACAELVRDGCKLADIGTDHAYLPVWLACRGIIKHAVACDINPGPLSAGAEDVAKFGMSDIIELRLSDGLKNVMENEADDIVIAGMGAELIIKIISECNWAKNPSKRFILQPMTKYELLIKWLYKNGYEIVSQRVCESHKKHYTVLLVQYCGNCAEIDDYFCYTGKLDTSDDMSKAFLSHTLTHLKKRSLSDSSLRHIISKIEEVVL